MDIKDEKLAEGWISARIMIEFGGMTEDELKSEIKKFQERLKTEKGMIILNETLAETKHSKITPPRLQKEVDAYTTIDEIEIIFKNFKVMSYFCTNYMPTTIEILEPSKITLSIEEINSFYGDLLYRLHNIDLSYRDLRSENIFLKKSMNISMSNFIIKYIASGPKTAEQVGQFTGIRPKDAENFLNHMVEKDKLKKEDDKYSLK